MIGNYCDFSWTEPDGTAGGMEGELVGVEKDERGDWWALVDWGYGAKVGACVVSIKTDDQHIVEKGQDQHFAGLPKEGE